MRQSKFSLTPGLRDFVGDYRRYGFKDKSHLVRTVLLRLKDELEMQSLRQSAALYAEIFGEDAELEELTEAALVDWPE